MVFGKRGQKNEEYYGDIRLAERLSELFGMDEVSPNLLEDVPNVFKTRGLYTYYLEPRLVEFDQRMILKSLGNTFTLIYEKPVASNFLQFYVVTPLKKSSLEAFFEVSVGMVPAYPYAAILKPTRKWHEEDYVIKDLPGVAASLPSGSGIAYSVVYDVWVQNKLRRIKAREDKKVFDARRDSVKLPPVAHEVMVDRARSRIFSTSIVVFAATREHLEEALEVVEIALPPFNRSIREFTPESEEKFMELFVPRRFTTIEKILSFRHMTVTERTLEDCTLFPEPQRHPIPFQRGARFRARVHRGGGFRIGTVEGRDFLLSPEDLYRHAYVLGQTGAGKTNLLKILARKLHEEGHCVIVIDPHGNMAEELAVTVKDAIFLDPVKSPFGLNPLKLPSSNEHDLSVTRGIDVLMNLFTNVFHLPETAINVRYLLQTVTRQLYRMGVEPTLAAIYKVVSDIYAGADVGIGDKEFREQEKILRNMPDQSFISTLGRLQSFATDKTLRRITSNTTIDIEKFVRERKMVLFSIPQSELGFSNTTLLASTLLLNIYYAMLSLNKNVTDDSQKHHVFVIVDEFQNLQSLPILTQILSEARKFGLHLIFAHQYVEQLTDEVYQAAINNAGIKFIFQVTGNVEKIKLIDPAFREDIVKTVVALPRGQCMVKITTTPKEAHHPPFILSVDYYNYPEVRDLRDACRDEYEPPDVELTLETINPILRYIELPFPPKQKILHALYKEGGEAYAQTIQGYIPYINDAGFNKILSRLAAEGYVTLEKKKGGRYLKLTNKFFKDFESVAPSENGKRILKAAVLYYLEKGYYVAPVKPKPKDPSPRPDLVVIPYEGNNLDYSSAVEVEIEASPAKNVNKQLIATFSKETPFDERHVWCTSENEQVVLEASKYANKPVKIYVLTEKGVRIVDPRRRTRAAVDSEVKQRSQQVVEKPETVEETKVVGQPEAMEQQQTEIEVESTPRQADLAEKTQTAISAPQATHDEASKREAESTPEDGEGLQKDDVPTRQDQKDWTDRVQELIANVDVVSPQQVSGESPRKVAVKLDRKPTPKVKPPFTTRSMAEEYPIAKFMINYLKGRKDVTMDRLLVEVMVHAVNKAAIPDDEIPKFVDIVCKHRDLAKSASELAFGDPRTFVELLYEAEFGSEVQEPVEEESIPVEENVEAEDVVEYEQEMSEEIFEEINAKSLSDTSVKTEVVHADFQREANSSINEDVTSNLITNEPAIDELPQDFALLIPEAEELKEESSRNSTVEKTENKTAEQPALTEHETPQELELHKESISPTQPVTEKPVTRESAKEGKQKVKKKKKRLHEVLRKEVMPTRKININGKTLTYSQVVDNKLRGALQTLQDVGGEAYLIKKETGQKIRIEDAQPGSYTLVVEALGQTYKFSVRVD